MTGWRALLLALVMALAVPGPPVAAHEASMGVLDLHEIRPDSYIGRWTLAPSFDPERMRFSFPPQCRWAAPLLDCDPPGLVGRIAIDNLGFNMSAVMLRVTAISGAVETYTLSATSPAATVLAGRSPDLRTWLELAATYVNLGIDHILLGLDHLLFVLGLMWIVAGGWQLAKTITAFTVGHSISLAAATFGLIGVPEKPLNAVIALSIAFVGVEIVKQRRGEGGFAVRYPWAVALGFGLVHGIGFAGALVALGIERKLLPVALLSFNVGVEIGQLAFVLAVLALFRAHRTLRATLPHRAGALPGYVIGVVAMFWFFGRMATLVAS